MVARNDRLRVPIIYHYVAHYREPVFRALLGSGDVSGIDFEIAADFTSNLPALKVVDHDRLVEDFQGRWTRLRNVWLPKNFLWQRGLLSMLLGRRPAAVIFLGDMHFLSTWVAAALARLRGIQVFMWTHGLLRRERGPKASARLAFYSLANSLLVYGLRAKNLLTDAGYPSHRVHAIFNSMDHPKQVAVRREIAQLPAADLRKRAPGFPAGKVLLFSGRLSVGKGLELLLKALARLTSGGEQISLVCVGDGPARADLEFLAVELGIRDRVVFWGACYDEEQLGVLFHLSDLSVSPGPVGLFAIHSLTYGTPVLISDALDSHGPEFEAITPGVNGAYFADGSVDGLATAIADSIRTLAKPTVSKACMRAVDDRYTPSNQAAIITALVRDACLPSGSSRGTTSLTK